MPLNLVFILVNLARWN